MCRFLRVCSMLLARWRIFKCKTAGVDEDHVKSNKSLLLTDKLKCVFRILLQKSCTKRLANITINVYKIKFSQNYLFYTFKLHNLHEIQKMKIYFKNFVKIPLIES